MNHPPPLRRNVKPSMLLKVFRRMNMANITEIRVTQKEWLFDLLKLRLRNEGKKIDELNEMIVRAKAKMEQEDVAWVEKMIKEL